LLATEDDVSFPALAFAPGALKLAAGQSDGKVRLWDTVTGREEGVFQAKGLTTILAVAVHGKGQRVSAAGEGGVVTWDVATGKPVVRPWGQAPATAAAFSADGTLVACGTPEGALEIRSLADGKVRRRLEGAAAGAVWTALALGGDGEHLAAGRSDGAVIVWDGDKKPATLQPD